MNTLEDSQIEKIKKSIRDIPDFPKPGIVFKDITTLLKDHTLFDQAAKMMIEPFQEKQIDFVVGVEARGFIFGGVISSLLNTGFIPLRKPGKLPAETVEVTYDLEYGQDTLAIHKDAFDQGNRILLVDDLLATGGTLLGACELVEKTGGEIVGISTLIELSFLNARDKLSKYSLHSVIQY